MTDDADQNAIRILLNDQAMTENRVHSADHLGNLETEEAFTALLDAARSPQEDDALFEAVGRSLAKVASAMGRGGDVTDLHPVVRAAYEG